jgi:hypothetical protein
MIYGRIPLLGGIAVECWLAEEHTRELEVTENPVEIGAPIVDHAFVKPQELVVEFGVSNTPLGFISDDFGERGTDRIGFARDLLFDLQSNKALLVVETLTGGNYARMLLQKITWRTDKKTVNAVRFSIKLKELILSSTAETQYTALPAEAKTKKKIAKAKKKGEKPAKELSKSSEKDKGKSDKAAKAEGDIKQAKGSILSRIVG